MNKLITGANGQLSNEIRIVYKNFSCDILPCRSDNSQAL